MKEYILLRGDRTVRLDEETLHEILSKPNCFINGYLPDNYEIYEISEKNRVRLNVTKNYEILEE